MEPEELVAINISGSCVDGPKESEYIVDGYVPLLKLYDLVDSETRWTRIRVPCSDAVAIYIPFEESAIAANGERCASIVRLQINDVIHQNSSFGCTSRNS